MPLPDEVSTALDHWCRFLGYGTPKAPLWTVGIEEGGSPRSFLGIVSEPFDRIPDIACDCTCEVAPLREGRTDVWTFSVELAAKVFEQDRRVVRDALGTEQSPVFLSNAYPLARRRTKQQHEFYELSEEVACELRSEYEKRVERTRPDVFRKVRDELSPGSVVVAHGKGRGNRVRELHKRAFLRRDETPVPDDDASLLVCQRSRLILTPFFGRAYGQMNSARIARIAKIVRRLLNVGN